MFNNIIISLIIHENVLELVEIRSKSEIEIAITGNSNIETSLARCAHWSSGVIPNSRFPRKINLFLKLEEQSRNAGKPEHERDVNGQKQRTQRVVTRRTHTQKRDGAWKPKETNVCYASVCAYAECKSAGNKRNRVISLRGCEVVSMKLYKIRADYAGDESDIFWTSFNENLFR